MYRFKKLYDKIWGFPSDSVVKILPANAGDIGDLGSITGLRRSPKVGSGNPVFLPRKLHGQRSLAGYSPGVTGVGYA